MNATISNVCSDLKTFAMSLEDIASADINRLIVTNVATATQPSITTSCPSNPERPWMLAGGVALGVAVIGALASKGIWPYIIGIGGIASIAYGKAKSSHDNGSKHVTPTQSQHSLQSYEVIEQILEICKVIENKWRDKVEEAKSIVQAEIESSDVDTSTKDMLFSQTYTTERISINTAQVTNAIENQPSEHRQQILIDFLSQVKNDIQQTLLSQVKIYSNISEKV